MLIASTRYSDAFWGDRILSTFAVPLLLVNSQQERFVFLPVFMTLAVKTIHGDSEVDLGEGPGDPELPPPPLLPNFCHCLKLMNCKRVLCYRPVTK